MTTKILTDQTFLNGQSVPNSEITNLVFAGFAHFTALQVRNKMIKGLDLHLERLRQASIELYGKTLADELVRSYIHSAVESGPVDQSLTVTIYSPKGEFTADSMDVEPKVLIRTAPPENGPTGSLRLAAINHDRPLAEIKHVGEIGKTYYLHQAVRQGFDDAVFMNTSGYLSEGTIWNLAFWDGKTVIWPKARILKGTMMAMVQRQLSQLKIPQRSEPITLNRLSELKGAAVMNSWTPGVSISEIASNIFTNSDQLISLLHRAYKTEPAKKF
ncbi:aminotransferase class IV family protein [Vibrio sp. Of7-15]|uniref:aminotransferase class IV family protein n=1 Tax=Vibrio sp. Of7-15 TaxID=2724879 RepID=UPI001EF1F258|nr:aminotransferase class IV family protein [Vibrio sp. Of7-15]MCG7500136.1 aminotransferase class IV family protein [Vibrio sp. Of7-15]